MRVWRSRCLQSDSSRLWKTGLRGVRRCSGDLSMKRRRCRRDSAGGQGWTGGSKLQNPLIYF
ncbi:uncharacterized protein K489DRAFT_382932 [Dissoconium aciculare CBS 342.82]|uniref:Uncharacterized protein n=1 Tax=Dissoconium aciculare CBS 342.82 TaxID=1314786 RepID=A0A6J3LZW3_9PEZI|nr:uncharacterized protein K489DRAFT_382932 [Dissoconium aciculare CBS 342.82]KAF1820177.1 hypothetical protein K489DRAFT_382932 [Dissoconium aciculare CBS 342.82]